MSQNDARFPYRLERLKDIGAAGGVAGAVGLQDHPPDRGCAKRPDGGRSDAREEPEHLKA